MQIPNAADSNSSVVFRAVQEQTPEEQLTLVSYAD